MACSTFAFVANKPAVAVLALLLTAAAQMATAAPSMRSMPLAYDIHSSSQTTQYPYDIKLDFANGKFRLTYFPQSCIYDYQYMFLFNGRAKDYPRIPNIANVSINAPFTGDSITYTSSAPCTETTPVDYVSYALLFPRSKIPVMSTVATTTVVCGYDYSSTCDVHACLNSGICDATTKKCKCPTGYVGNKCEVMMKSAANDLCKGYLNSSCVVQGGNSVCLNGGQYQAVADNEFICLCRENFVGKHCQTAAFGAAKDLACIGNPCANGGTCQAFDESTYTCQCQPGFAGARCENQIAVPACADNPCKNGKCIRGIDGSSPYYCQCPPAFGGRFCEVPVILNNTMCDASVNPCLHDGKCIIAKSADGVIHYRYCQCKDNWIGPYCEFQGRQRTITVENRCSEKIFPALQGNPLPRNGGFKLDAGESQSFQVPSNWISTRIWGRTNCTYQNQNDGSVKLVCGTGDCTKGEECMGAGSNDVSLAEFTLGTSDTYDVSLVDGFNLPIAIVPSQFPALARSQNEFIYAQCRQTYCANDLNLDCPPVSQVLFGTQVVGCKSSCNTFQKDEYCCRGDFGTPDKCSRPAVSEMSKKRCPLSYTYAYDDHTSTFTCPDFAEPNYTVIFCP